MDEVLLDLLRQVDTPTVCNAIEMAEGRRGFAAFTRATPVSSAPDAPAMVGYARTARIRGRAPSSEAPDTLRARRMAYYRYMAEGPRPSIAVVEDADQPDCVAAFWGEVNATIHRGLGLSGALTNGVVRDLGDLPDGFPIVAGSVGVSHGFVHVLDFATPVTVLGLAVAPGDLIHADRHGAVAIPQEILLHLHAAIKKLIATEILILEPARKEGFDFDALEAAWSCFEKSRI